jgi:Holliday junction resolvasome RuvABC endonuclease subunit
MTPVVGVDPGLRDCGVGVVDVDTGRVLRGWLSVNPVTSKSPEPNDGPVAWRAMARTIGQEVRALLDAGGWVGEPPLLVLERQFFPRDNPMVVHSIARLIGISGALTLAIPAHQVVDVMPSQWKGGSTKGRAAKAKVNLATWDAMDAQERAAAPDAAGKTRGHNVKDGLGIAKWAALNFAHLMATGSAKGARRL